MGKKTGVNESTIIDIRSENHHKIVKEVDTNKKKRAKTCIECKDNKEGYCFKYKGWCNSVNYICNIFKDSHEHRPLPKNKNKLKKTKSKLSRKANKEMNISIQSTPGLGVDCMTKNELEQKNKLKRVNIYVTASCYLLEKDKPGKYNAIMEYKGKHKTLNDNGFNTTTNRMLIIGIIDCIRLLKEKCNLYIYTGCSFGYKRLEKAVKKDGKVKGINRDLLEILKHEISKKNHYVNLITDNSIVLKKLRIN